MLKLSKLTPQSKCVFWSLPLCSEKFDIDHGLLNIRSPCIDSLIGKLFFTYFYHFEKEGNFFSWIVRQRLYEGMLILIAFLQLLFKILKLKWLQFCQGLFPPTNYHYAIFISSSASNLFFLILKHRHWRKQKYLGKQKIATYHGSKYNYSQKN